MPSAEVITIGTELLLGEIVDTNAQYLARTLRLAGIDLYHIVTTGDNAQRTAHAIQVALERSDIVITTGGLGPTVDDPTREAVALALQTKVEYHPELWDQIQSRFKRFNRQPTQNNQRQAFLPIGCTVVENPVGTAPAFICETNNNVLISLPGVPSEMVYLMEKSIIPYLHKKFQIQSVIKTRTLHTVGVGESQIDDLIEDLERLSNPTVGLAAHSGQVDVRITAKAESDFDTIQLIKPIEQLIRDRLEPWIYGVDDDTLENIAMSPLKKRQWSLATFEAGLSGLLTRRLVMIGKPFVLGHVLANPPKPDDFQMMVRKFHQHNKTDVTLAVAIYPLEAKSDVMIFMITPEGEQVYTKSYGGPPEYASHWAFHYSLDVLRGI